MPTPKRIPCFSRLGARTAILLVLLLLLVATSTTLEAQESPAGGTIPLPTEPFTSIPSIEATAATPTFTPTPATTPATGQLQNPQRSTSLGDVFIRINEVMYHPLSVPSVDGEWIEIFNTGSESVDLRDWTVSTDTASVVIAVELVIPAQGYMILASQSSAARNGGVTVDYQYGAITLPEASALVLRNGAGQVIDSVRWNGGESDKGKSIERVDFDVPDHWRAAWRAWPGSAGDWGSPRAENVPPPTPTPKPLTPTRTPTSTRTLRPTATPRNTATPQATETARASVTPGTTLTPVASATALPPAWQWLNSPSPLWLEEVGFRGGGEEYVVLGNRSATSVDLNGWLLADATYPGADEGAIVLPTRVLEPGDWVIVARNGADFQARWGLLPHIQLLASSAPLPQGRADKILGRGSFSLNDRGDTLLLITPDLRIADAVTFGASGDDDDRIALIPRIVAPTDSALHRLPDAQPPQNADQRDEWLADSPSPFAPLAEVGAPTTHANPAVGTAWRAYWGNLNTLSSYTPGATGALPARWALRLAASQGLDFVAFADPQTHANLWEVPSTLTHLPAWRWQGSDGETAILYDNLAGGFADRWSLLPWLMQRHPLVQWVAGETPALPGVSMVQIREGTLEQMRARALALWRQRGAPLLPMVEGWLTGVAAEERAANGLHEALEHARGWTTNDSRLLLDLSIEANGGRAWMGSEIDATNNAVLHIAASHASGARVQVQVWQNETLLFEGSLGEGDSIARGVVAAPDSWFYATSDSSGSQALSAPVHVRAKEGGALILTEALADPLSDWNGDGAIDDGDEFIELFNAGSHPVSLAGWKLQDKREAQDGGGEYRFGPEESVAGGAYLVLWRSQTKTVLNSNDEAIFLRSPGGGMASEVWWDESQPPDRSVARVGNGWAYGVMPSPGRAADASGAAVSSAPYVSATNAPDPQAAQVDRQVAWTSGEVITFVGAVASVADEEILLADLIHPASAPLVVRVADGGSLPAMTAGEVWRASGEVVDEADGSSWLRVSRGSDLVRIEVR